MDHIRLSLYKWGNSILTTNMSSVYMLSKTLHFQHVTMVYTCTVKNIIGTHTYIRGNQDEIDDYINNFFVTQQDNKPMVIEIKDRSEGVFAHLMADTPILYCETCDIIVNSQNK